MQKILLIDDDVLVSKTLRLLFERHGYQIDCAFNAIDAVSLVAINDYDLVISDIRMPGENGVIAIERIKKIYEEKAICCGYIFISGFAEEDTPAHAIRLGVNKFLFKPFDNDEILKSVKEELDLVRQEELLKRPEQSSHSLRSKKTNGSGWAERKRVVVTGIGAVSPNGIGKAAFWENLRKGTNCVREISSFDVADFPSKMAAEIRGFIPENFIEDPTEIKRIARSSQFAVAASKLAINDSGLEVSNLSDAAVIIGSSTAGIEYMLPAAYAFERGGISKVRPYVGIAGFVGSISSEVSRALQIKGMSHTISTGCTSSTDAMGYAFRQIQYGFQDCIVVGGADACVTPGILAAFCRMGATSTRQPDFDKASRPFNKDRDGFVISEGSWVFVFEELSKALKRNAKIYGEVVGYGATCDAWHMAKPHPSGSQSALAIQLALQDARIALEEVDIFEAYGNSTPINDSYETSVIKKVFNQHAFKLCVPSVKSMLGHPIGAAGAAQVAAALLALSDGFIHPTINYDTPDPQCDLDYVPNEGRKGDFNVALCNSLAFGGKNASLLLKAYNLNHNVPS